jgi:tRNA-dihydrouridine synthase B
MKILSEYSLLVMTHRIFLSQCGKYLDLPFDFININMGCPTPKIVKNGDGCALMKDLKLASK